MRLLLFLLLPYPADYFSCTRSTRGLRFLPLGTVQRWLKRLSTSLQCANSLNVPLSRLPFPRVYPCLPTARDRDFPHLTQRSKNAGSSSSSSSMSAYSTSSASSSPPAFQHPPIRPRLRAPPFRTSPRYDRRHPVSEFSGRRSGATPHPRVAQFLLRLFLFFRYRPPTFLQLRN